MIVIDARGLAHPEHIRKFREEMEQICSVSEDVEVLIDDDRESLKKLEMYIRTLRCRYAVSPENECLKLRIEGPFSMCG